MKKTIWIILFCVVLAANLIAIYTENETLQTISKPLIVLTLIAYFITATSSLKSWLKKWIIIALFFSWVGDVLLMFEKRDSLFFLLGLSAFLLAHVFYILFFHAIRVMENIKSNVLFLLVVVVYYAILQSILEPFLGNMKLPVRVYGVVISFMLLLALHMLFIKQKTTGRWIATGACFFVISDTLLAINKFYLPFEYAGIVILLIYGLAQLFIIEGAVRYINKV